MVTTIDKAGRVVIPAAIREAARLTPGTKIEVVLDDLSVRLVRSVPRPEITSRGKRLIARPRAAAESLPDLDLAVLVERERNRLPK